MREAAALRKEASRLEVSLLADRRRSREAVPDVVGVDAKNNVLALGPRVLVARAGLGERDLVVRWQLVGARAVVMTLSDARGASVAKAKGSWRQARSHVEVRAGGIGFDVECRPRRRLVLSNLPSHGGFGRLFVSAMRRWPGLSPTPSR